MSGTPTPIDEYLADFPEEMQGRLSAIRDLLLEVWPGATEGISYKMPIVRPPKGWPLYFAAWKHHIGLYPVPRFEEPLEAEVAPLRRAKDSVGFPNKEPLPLDLIRRIALAAVQH